MCINIHTNYNFVKGKKKKYRSFFVGEMSGGIITYI